MFRAMELLLILSIAKIELSLQQSFTKYERITVKTSSFNDIRTTNLQTTGNLLCASMCKTNGNCEAYYQQASHCHEAAASSLEGSSSPSSGTRDVFINQIVYINNKSDGQWQWGSWSTCSTTCGPGTRTRSAISCSGPFYAGMPCGGSGAETETCQVEGTWAGWGSWSTCSASCGTGSQTRSRSYSGGLPCTGSASDTQNCQVEGAWAAWGTWSSCSTSCDSDGVVTRTRSYTGGVPCSGTNTDTQGCQIEGTWDHWSSWGACSTTCDSTGTWSRSRTHSGNMPCTGSNTETAGCQSEGTWDSWGVWGACSTTCDSTGTWMRSRAHVGNKPCVGSDTETTSCQAEGSWNSWGSWGTCSTMCDSTGVWSRSRTFNGNMPCTGADTETGSCQIEGTWNVWGPWGACSGACDNIATRSRTRGFNGGTTPCTGLANDSGSCTVEGVWSAWGSWSSCAVGQSTISRARSHSGGNPPCSASNNETKSFGSACCSSPALSISYQECFDGCARADNWYRGQNVLTDNVPESQRYFFWAADRGNVGYKFRVALGCPKTISSVSMRQSAYFSFCSTKDFAVRVREPGSGLWLAFVSATLSSPSSSPPMETFGGAPATVEEVEFHCLTSWGDTCALNYIEFA